MAKTPRRILTVLCLLAAVFFLLPLGIGILHFGMVWPAALLLLCAAWLTWPDFFRRLLRPKWLRALVGCVIAVCMTAILVTLGKMAMAAADRPADGQDCTVVVLGCQVFPDGHPSLMLRGRINAAYDYLTAHPDALCVASGGQNGSEPISEAQCIRDTLVSMGIAPERILLEDQSASTEENLAFSAVLLREKGLSTDVAIASDNFHQLRAAIWAQRSGLTPYSDGCASPWFLTAGYWARETAALTMAYQIGSACVSCGACADACPVGAISQGDDRYVIDAGACLDCGSCADTCPNGAISPAE